MKSFKNILQESEETVKIKDIKTYKYAGADQLFDSIKDFIDDDLDGNVQLLDAAQTLIYKVINALTLATSELKDNYSNQEIKAINKINNSLRTSFDDIDKILDKYI